MATENNQQNLYDIEAKCATYKFDLLHYPSSETSHVVPKLPLFGVLNINDIHTFLEDSKLYFKHVCHSRTVSDVKIGDFVIKKMLGPSVHARIIKVKHKDTGDEYAITVKDKHEIMDNLQLEHVINRKRIFCGVNFPFIVHIEYFFVDIRYMYFVTPFIHGNDFLNYVHSQGKLAENCAKFYVGQIVLALEYLHYLGIVYVEIKPINIIIDKNGYIKITNFNVCSNVGKPLVNCKKCCKKFPCIFTDDIFYTAPELLSRFPSNENADWWCLGVLIFETCSGEVPFKGDHVHESIIRGTYMLPEYFTSTLTSLTKRLLQVNPKSRLGSNGVDEIKNHRWFQNINWLNLVNRGIEPPYVPDTK